MSTWINIHPFGPDAYQYWVRGIYKIVSYGPGEFSAFFIREDYTCWGDYVSPPPHEGKWNKCWNSLESAMAACDEHQRTHSPSKKTLAAAAKCLEEYLAQEKENTPLDSVA